MKSYFVRHTRGIAVLEKAIDYLWEQDKIGIHFPEVYEERAATPEDVQDSVSINKNDYEGRGAKRGISTFSELNANGGYIWAEYQNRENVKIGKIVPHSFDIYETKWLPGEFPYQRKALLKTLRIDRKNVRIITPNEAMALRAARPIQGTITRWPSAKNRLKNLVEGIPIDKSWGSLFPSEQETVCSEYLRNPDVAECPTLKRLLLPVGRTLKDVDIYGYAADGKTLFAQVTYSNKYEVNGKIQDLQKYDDSRSHLVFFCNCEDVEYEGNVLFIPVERVQKWLENDKRYQNRLFG